MQRRTRIGISIFFGLFLPFLLGGWWYVRRLPSPLSVLTLFNPRSEQTPKLSATLEQPLQAVTLRVPAPWQTAVFTEPRQLELRRDGRLPMCSVHVNTGNGSAQSIEQFLCTEKMLGTNAGSARFCCTSTPALWTASG